MKKKKSADDRERIEGQLRQIQEQKNLKEMPKERDDNKWDINQMSEFDFVRCDYSQW